ncbi:hypothetical protein [Propionivibrio sp.]|uniref:hypothetical protein n=1 Tax=Propionivibrio sp. TaxID=2212460 RepID=UPI0034580F76
MPPSFRSIPKATEIVWCQEEPRNQGLGTGSPRVNIWTVRSAASNICCWYPSGVASPAAGCFSKHITHPTKKR